MQSTSEEEKQKGEDDSSLDFLSPQFDPLKALTSNPSKIQLPCPEVPPCDNLVMYDQVVRGVRKVYTEPQPEEQQALVPIPPSHAPVTPTPPSHSPPAVTSTQLSCVSVTPTPLSHASVMLTPSSHVPITPTLPSQAPPSPIRPLPRPPISEPKFYFKSVVAFMKRSNLGPFQMLHDCWTSSSPVRVWTRHCVGVRGMCEGVPLAFDKHMNLVLCDVIEYFQPFKTLGNGGLDGRKKKKKKKSDSENSHVTKTNYIRGCTLVIGNLDSFQIRTLSILFIRGDNIVIISPINK